MTPERWQQIRRVFDQAIALPDEHRAAYIEKACSEDAELHREVESLLHANEQAGTGFLNTPAVDFSSNPDSQSASHLANLLLSRVGRRIGSYNILEEIGHGGMGEVYRAARADGQYEKEVAVKLVRGGYDTASVLERFRHERQILASLDHPNIARLLDGGTTEEGIPYLVMELVRGQRIDLYCDEHKLDITARLDLFARVCAAVQYAHQRLVIHRDIKPGNILVTEEGVPKLLDFGIAKILDSAAGAESTAAAPMTPEYASPEQIRGETITTATDVYSLGVVLYQLLTGRSPYPANTRTPHEFARAICDYEPERPSTIILKPAGNRQSGEGALPSGATSQVPEGSTAKLSRRIRGDLDTIVLRAMSKEPQRRYASVEQFADDIRRHLKGLPVAARRDSWRYRTGKFVLRHKLGVAALALALIAVLGGVAATIREARIAAANERRAEQRFNDVRKLANSLMFEIHDSIRDLPGSTSARRLLVTRAQEYLDSLSQQSKGDASLQKELAAAYDRVGDVLGYPYAANLGDKEGALQSYRKALAIREPLAAANPNDAQLQWDVDDTNFRIAHVLEASGKFSEALDALKKAAPTEQQVAAGKFDPVVYDHFAGAYFFTASIQVRTGDVAAALQNYQRSAAIRDSSLQVHPGNFTLITHLAGDYTGMAKCMALNHDLAHAIPMQAKANAILDDVVKSNPGNAMLSEYLGEGTNRLATYRKDSGDPASALETYKRSHQIFADLLAADPKNSLAKSNFGFSDNGIADSLVALGKAADAVKVYRESIASFEEMSARTASTRYPRTGLAEAYWGLGDAYMLLAARKGIPTPQRRDDWQQAHSACEKSMAVWADKEKRQELESDEHEDIPKVGECLAKSEAKFGHRR